MLTNVTISNYRFMVLQIYAIISKEFTILLLLPTCRKIFSIASILEIEQNLDRISP